MFDKKTLLITAGNKVFTINPKLHVQLAAKSFQRVCLDIWERCVAEIFDFTAHCYIKYNYGIRYER